MKEESYSITVKGIIYLSVEDPEIADKVWADIEKYAKRFNLNGILVEGGGHFIRLEGPENAG